MEELFNQEKMWGRKNCYLKRKRKEKPQLSADLTKLVVVLRVALIIEMQAKKVKLWGLGI